LRPSISLNCGTLSRKLILKKLGDKSLRVRRRYLRARAASSPNNHPFPPLKKRLWGEILVRLELDGSGHWGNPPGLVDPRVGRSLQMPAVSRKGRGLSAGGVPVRRDGHAVRLTLAAPKGERPREDLASMTLYLVKFWRPSILAEDFA
jgi:hypothetical protein